MISFDCDYNKGAHPEILKKLIETNYEVQPGYGFDSYTQSAKERIKKACGGGDIEVEFLVGGTQTNMVVISTLLKDYQGVIAADTGHVSVHESGAIEYSGIKVISITGTDGKLKAEDLKAWVDNFYSDATYEHMVIPGMVYISQPTELGTLYSKAEMESLAEICRERDMLLYVDGARLGYGLMSYESDMTLEDVARIADVFYIGGTKVGALCGEAVVFTGGCKPEYFMTSIKKRGALLAKGRVLGVQFDALFTDDLYFKISKHAIDMAEKVKEIIKEKGWDIYLLTPTNQQFVLFDEKQMEEVGAKVGFDRWAPYDETRTIVRFATSWSTTEEEIEALRKV